jgi:hypothetical protein
MASICALAATHLAVVDGSSSSGNRYAGGALRRCGLDCIVRRLAAHVVNKASASYQQHRHTNASNNTNHDDVIGGPPRVGGIALHFPRDGQLRCWLRVVDIAGDAELVQAARSGDGCWQRQRCALVVADGGGLRLHCKIAQMAESVVESGVSDTAAVRT